MLSSRLLQAVVAIGGLVPVGAGLAGVLFGTGAFGGAVSAGGDSQFRYLSGLLLAIGLGFWSTIPAIGQRTARFRLLTALVVCGGLCRLLGLFLAGPVPPGMLFGLVMELGVTPALCWWQGRIAAAAAKM